MKAEMTSYFAEKESLISDCELIHRHGELVVSYDDEDACGRPLKVIYKGKSVRRGHWVVAAQEFNWRATLSLSAIDPCVLEGRWFEDGHEGMWKIEADDSLDVLLRIAEAEE